MLLSTTCRVGKAQVPVRTVHIAIMFSHFEVILLREELVNSFGLFIMIADHSKVTLCTMISFAALRTCSCDRRIVHIGLFLIARSRSGIAYVKWHISFN